MSNQQKSKYLQIEQKGNFIFAHSNRSPEEQEKLIEKLANKYSSIKYEINELIKWIQTEILKYNPIELLNCIYGVMSVNILTKKHDDIMLVKALEYTQSIIVSSAAQLPYNTLPTDRLYTLLEKIKELYTKIHIYNTCWAAYRKKNKDSFDGDLEKLYFTLIPYWTMVRGDRYMYFDTPFLEYFLLPHEEIISQTYGIKIKDVVIGLKNIQYKLSKRYPECFRIYQEAQKLIMAEVINRNINSFIEKENIAHEIFENNPMYQSAADDFFQMHFLELDETFNWPKSLLNDLSYTCGEDILFSNSPDSFWPIKDLPIRRRPFLKHNNKYYCFNIYSVFDNFYRKMNELVICHNPEYKETWNKKQKNISEKAPLVFLNKILKKSQSLSEICYKIGSGNWAECDGLVEYCGILFVIEVKAGKYNRESPYNDFEGHVKSIRDLILKPAKQALRFIDLLQTNKSIDVYDSNHVKRHTFCYENLHLIIPLCVTLESLTFLNAIASNFQSVIQNSTNKMWAISLDDLMVIADLFENNPLRFCHYAKVRWEFSKAAKSDVTDELEHIGLYYEYNNYVESAENILKHNNINSLIFDGHSKIIGDYYASLFQNNGDKSNAVHPDPIISTRIDHFLNLFKLYLSPSIVQGLFLFMDYEIENQHIIAGKILNSIDYVYRSKKTQCFIDNRKTIRTTLMSIVYTPVDDDFILNYVKYHFIQCETELLYLFKLKIIDSVTTIPEVEILSREDILRNSTETVININIGGPMSFFSHGHKMGRNDKCPCGSGLKYKQCCLAPHL